MMTTPISKKVFIHSKYVCERAKTDAQKIAVYFKRNGYIIINNPRKADVIIFNSCGYSNPIAQQCLQEIQKLKHYKADIVVIGGLPESDKEAYTKIFTGKTLSHKDLEHIDALFPHHSIKFKDLIDCNISWLTVDETTPSGALKKILVRSPLTKKLYTMLYDIYFQTTLGKHYLLLSNPFDIPTDSIYRIEIARGCSFQCTYCAIRKGIGSFHSKPFATCIDEFEHGLAEGYTTFYITAPDPGCYGTDQGTSYPQLLDSITSHAGNYQILLDGLNPVWLVRYLKDLIPILKRGNIVALSVPIQSGNSRILSLMRRYSDTKKMVDAIRTLKHEVPHLTITTNCIVGFPTETNDEFYDTLRFVEHAGFDMGFINPISLKQQTKAADLEPKIPDDEIRNRIHTAKTRLKRLRYNAFLTKTGGVVFGGKH